MKRIFLEKIGNGSAWCLFGLFSLFDNTICKIIAALILAFAVFFSIIVIRVQGESEDEMSIVHLRHARSTTYEKLLMVVAIAGIVSALGLDFVISYKVLFPFLIGVAEILVGYYFIYYEKVGD